METEYTIIEKFYANRCAKRSGVPLMNHISEGLDILIGLNASDRAMDAFCIHPIVQNDEEGFDHIKKFYSYELAVEYKERANAYLCKPETDYIKTNTDIHDLVGPMSKDCRDMLIADKIQNQKDFLIYHMNTHERSQQLFKYFHNWITYLYSEEWK